MFGGSGSTLIGCDKMERKARLNELEPGFCDAIVKRYIKHCQDNNKELDIKINGEQINLDIFYEKDQ
jgi:DNA modification methylase